ncbi:GrlR family regulatory protein [Biostraticola tofi]|uniref:Type III secretion system (T3SS) negative regulator GrlR n=1 Tax=Biostraticola tofi TaxID=466109 RepID=A0A4R3YHS3_9GAMM|nr:GrlR family regulatory protein [Biostraticola tofi]TCV91720.1 type III secretion system (T3SS) negative regulator GrlR [Biostraticola tofi]
MKNGLYAVNFRSNNQDYGSGIVSVNNDAVNGGDFGFYYQGKFSGNQIKLSVRQFNSNAQSVFGPLNNFHLILSISDEGNNGYLLEGHVAENASFRLQVTAKKVADLTC